MSCIELSDEDREESVQSEAWLSSRRHGTQADNAGGDNFVYVPETHDEDSSPTIIGSPNTTTAPVIATSDLSSTSSDHTNNVTMILGLPTEAVPSPLSHPLHLDYLESTNSSNAKMSCDDFCASENVVLHLSPSQPNPSQAYPIQSGQFTVHIEQPPVDDISPTQENISSRRKSPPNTESQSSENLFHFERPPSVSPVPHREPLDPQPSTSHSTRPRRRQQTRFDDSDDDELSPTDVTNMSPPQPPPPITTKSVDVSLNSTINISSDHDITLPPEHIDQSNDNIPETNQSQHQADDTNQSDSLPTMSQALNVSRASILLSKHTSSSSSTSKSSASVLACDSVTSVPESLVMVTDSDIGALELDVPVTIATDIGAETSLKKASSANENISTRNVAPPRRDVDTDLTVPESRRVFDIDDFPKSARKSKQVLDNNKEIIHDADDNIGGDTSRSHAQDAQTTNVADGSKVNITIEPDVTHNRSVNSSQIDKSFEKYITKTSTLDDTLIYDPPDYTTVTSSSNNPNISSESLFSTNRSDPHVSYTLIKQSTLKDGGDQTNKARTSISPQFSEIATRVLPEFPAEDRQEDSSPDFEIPCSQRHLPKSPKKKMKPPITPGLRGKTMNEKKILHKSGRENDGYNLTRKSPASRLIKKTVVTTYLYEDGTTTIDKSEECYDEIPSPPSLSTSRSASGSLADVSSSSHGSKPAGMSSSSSLERRTSLQRNTEIIRRKSSLNAEHEPVTDRDTRGDSGHASDGRHLHGNPSDRLKDRKSSDSLFTSAHSTPEIDNISMIEGNHGKSGEHSTSISPIVGNQPIKNARLKKSVTVPKSVLTKRFDAKTAKGRKVMRGKGMQSKRLLDKGTPNVDVGKLSSGGFEVLGSEKETSASGSVVGGKRVRKGKGGEVVREGESGKQEVLTSRSLVGSKRVRKGKAGDIVREGESGGQGRGVDEDGGHEDSEEIGVPLTTVAGKKRKKPTQSDASLEISLIAGSTSHLYTSLPHEIGATVMARWLDGYYYPGTISALPDTNTCVVQYDDGDQSTISCVYVIVIDQLPVGQSVMVESSDGTYEPGIVTGYQGRRERLSYVVECDSGTSKTSKRREVILSSDQAACLSGTPPQDISITANTSRASVSLDNILDSSRRQKPSTSSAVNSPKTPARTPSRTPTIKKASSTASSGRKPRGVAVDDPPTSKGKGRGKRLANQNDQSIPKARKTDQSDLTGEKITSEGKLTSSRKRKLESFTPQGTSTPTTPQSKYVGSGLASSLSGIVQSPVSKKRHPLKKAQTDLFGEVKGPLPDDPELFRGYTFILSHVAKTDDRVREEKRLDKYWNTSGMVTSDTSADDSTLEYTQVVPFDKDHLERQIKGGGGVVLESFDSSLISSDGSCCLISDSYQRTKKYLHCLAARVPCVSHNWVINSCKQGVVLDRNVYLLPAGISLEKNAIVEVCKNESPFIHVHVQVMSADSETRDDWSSILTSAGAVVTTCTPRAATIGKGVEVVVTDSSCTATFVNKASKSNVPLVSTEWCIQSLITRILRPYKALPRYQHDYVPT